MQSQSVNKPSRMTAEAVQPLLAHFDAQEAAMLALKSLLYDIGMQDGRDSQTRELLVRIDAANRLMQRLSSDFHLILDQVATATGLPRDTLSVRKLIQIYDRLDPATAESLRGSRGRLLSLRWQVSRVAAASGWIVGEQQRMRQAVLREAAGVSNSDRYDASGRHTLTPDALRFGKRS